MFKDAIYDEDIILKDYQKNDMKTDTEVGGQIRKVIIFFKHNKGELRLKVPIQDVIYFKNVNREIKVVSNNKIDYFYSSMEEIVGVVSNNQFVRIHRSYLINYNQVSVFKYDQIIMSNGDILPISQSRRKRIKEIQVNKELGD